MVRRQDEVEEKECECFESFKEEGVKKQQDCRVEGVLYSYDDPIVMISGKSYSLNDTVCGGVIKEVSPQGKISMQFASIDKVYRVGGIIEQEMTSEIPDNLGEIDGNESSDILNLEINPLLEFDFKTRAEMYDIRKKYVGQYSQLGPKNYRPSDAVFGQIEDNKPWWGMEGQFFYGPGEKSIVGLSEESRFIVNPYLLVGLDEGHAFVISDPRLTPKAFYPIPKELMWKKSCPCAKVIYNINKYWRDSSVYNYHSATEKRLDLIAYNARDLGYSYFYLVPDKSHSIVSGNKTTQAVPINFFIHKGGSCGYPEGCNNMSPDDSNFRFNIEKLPARLHIKLWRSQPKDVKQNPDMIFIIDLV